MGRQDVTLTVDQQQMLAGVLGNEYCDNICGQILSEHGDRLELKRITAKDETVQSWIDDFWQKKKFDDLQQRTHRIALREGNFCLMVDYDYGRKEIVIQRERWWDGFTGVFIGYDTYGQKLYAVKEWNTVDGIRRTIYYDGIIERYISTGGAAESWLPFALSSDSTIEGIGTVTPGAQPKGSESIAIPYTDEDGQPLHIPFIHFANPGDEFENYGMSILDGGPIGAQDQINDINYDILSAARMTGYQRTWSKGYPLQKSKAGVTIKPKTGPGVHYHAESIEAEWGVLQAGDMTQLINVLSAKIQNVCRMTGTPYAAITGNWPSGEAVYKLEQPIRGKTKARQKRFSPAWQEVMHRCIELSNAIEHTNLDENSILTSDYADAGDRDPLTIAMSELSFWQAAQAAVLAGLPLETFLRVQGWGDDKLRGMSTDVVNEIKQRQQDLLDSSPENNNGTRPKGSGGANTAPNNAKKPTAKTQETARKQG